MEYGIKVHDLIKELENQPAGSRVMLIGQINGKVCHMHITSVSDASCTSVDVGLHFDDPKGVLYEK